MNDEDLEDLLNALNVVFNLDLLNKVELKKDYIQISMPNKSKINLYLENN